MAVLGTTLASVAAIPIAVLAARATAPHPLLSVVARGTVVVCRVVPDIAFALFFVAMTGIGPLPGILALALHSIGMLGRLFTEAVERIDPGPLEAADAAGAGPLQRLSAGVLPQVTPAFLSAVLYRLDVNFRGATLLGFVGAGGLGLLLQKYGGAPTTYAQLLTVVVVIMVCCLAFEGVSVFLRRAVGGPMLDRPGAVTARTADVPGVDRQTLRAPWNASRRRIWAFGVLCGITLVGAAVLVDVDLADLAKLGTGLVDGIVAFTPTPATFLDDTGGVPFYVELLDGLTQTVAVALVAIVGCAALGVTWGLLAARNVAPHPVLYGAARSGLVLARAVPEAAVAVLAVAVFGLEPVTAVLVLILAIWPFLAKLVADVTEEIRPGPREAIISTGATRLQELGAGVWAQIVPAVTASVLYAFDVMVRAIPILGVIGVGKLGYTMSQAFRGMQYDLVGAIIAALFVIVLAIQLVSDRLRHALS
jgi:phosphonate transport system permease protein